jgi:hypothetical protein
LRRLVIADGRVQVRRQCRVCGALGQDSVPQRGLDVAGLPPVDKEARDDARLGPRLWP